MEKAEQDKENNNHCGVVFSIDDDSCTEELSPLTDVSSASVLSISEYFKQAIKIELSSSIFSTAATKNGEGEL